MLLELGEGSICFGSPAEGPGRERELGKRGGHSNIVPDEPAVEVLKPPESLQLLAGGGSGLFSHGSDLVRINFHFQLLTYNFSLFYGVT